jgi:diguanylate cyclase (GGDEF)-like protein
MRRQDAQDPIASTASAGEGAQPEAFRVLMQGVAVVAGLTHLAFLALFHWAGVAALADVNVGSVLCYVGVFLLARRHKTGQALMLATAEVLGHAILAVAVIGWETGFHYYILLVIPVAVISSIRPLALKAGTVMAVMLSYLTLDIAFRHRAASGALSSGVVDGLHYFNVLGAMVILIFLAGFYFHLIDQSARALRDMAETDPLTQLKNRRAIQEIIRREESRVRRGQPHLSFILCDLDHFKCINDDLGHECGDLVLRQVSHLLRNGVRDVDYVARWGGEEFLIVLPDTNSDTACMVAERLRQGLADQPLSTGETALAASMTMGVATLRPDETSERAIARADAALYSGKRSGRNKVVSAEAG